MNTLFKNTPHINQTAEIAERILMPGDPMRAKYIAENFLESPVQFNSVRGMYGATGMYNGKKLSVMGSGMGIPSIGIYSYELINFFGVKELIRVGSCGALQDDMEIFDIVIGVSASTNSDFVNQFNLPGNYAPTANFSLVNSAINSAKKLNIKPHIGNVLSSDTFYSDNKTEAESWRKMGVLGIEMEAAALYMNAARYNAKALCILTVSDHIITHKETTAKERETHLNDMIRIALEME